MASVTAEDIKSELDTFNIDFNNDTVDKSKRQVSYLLVFVYKIYIVSMA